MANINNNLLQRCTQLRTYSIYYAPHYHIYAVLHWLLWFRNYIIMLSLCFFVVQQLLIHRFRKGNII